MNATGAAREAARFVRGCTTDEQYTELVARIENAIRLAENEALERAAEEFVHLAEGTSVAGPFIVKRIRALKNGEWR